MYCGFVITDTFYRILVHYRNIIMFWWIFFYINSKVKRLVYGNLSLFDSRRHIKKYTTMVIGDCCSESNYLPYCNNKEEVIAIMSPNRSLNASYQILLHTFCILDEGSTCIIVCKKKMVSNDISFFDIPYLNTITQKELGIESLRHKLLCPLIFSPVITLKQLLDIKSVYHNDTCPNNDIVEFCKKRGLRLIYMTDK